MSAFLHLSGISGMSLADGKVKKRQTIIYRNKE